MKKFKLIKEYPGSFELGTILEYDSGYYVKKNVGNTAIRRELVENNPEFWEEIIDREYEILSLKYSNNIYNKIDKSEEDWKYYRDSKNFCYLSQAGKNICGIIEIHSIKRLSDGELFTIGDKVDSTISDLGRLTDLTKFKIIDGKLTVGLRHLGYYPLSTIIVPNSNCYIISNWQIIPHKTFGAIGIDTNRGEVPLDLDFINEWYKLVFSTKEAAEEFILWNKPVLSLKDVASIYPGINKHHSNTPSHQAEKIKQLVKSKL